MFPFQIFPFNFVKKLILVVSILVATQSNYLFAQNGLTSIDVSKVKPIELHNLPKLGGTNPKKEAIAVNNYFITMGGAPIIPITGEFHFSRYPNAYWEESIEKIKAGGVNTIATYVFWNIHEEHEGDFKWSGDLNLRKFIELCEKHGLMVIVRIGPFDHGEIRNGGFPDWLLGKPLTVRTNDPLYLQYVDRLYKEIGGQLKGLYYQNGGPIIGVQLENEYQHSASPWGLTYPGQPYDMTVADQDRKGTQEGVGIATANNPYANVGNDHMRTLKELALKNGIDAPIYTATGWGYAAIIPDETLPVTAAYAYPTWTPKAEPSPFYLYKDMHNSPDYAPVRYKPMDYPAFAAELGAGMAVNYTRRPTVLSESIDALINRCLGSGANGIGYYMFHGGSSPTGDEYFFSDEAYAYPKISYDYQAPIGEYGQVRESYKRLKLLHYFINDFAPQIAPKTTTLPNNVAQVKPDNLQDLRYAVRSDGKSGFLFINNFQDNVSNTDKNNIRFSIKTKEGDVSIPGTGSFNLKSNENLILPFNFSINDCLLYAATAQLFTKINQKDGQYFVFFSPDGTVAKFDFSAGSTTVSELYGAQVSKSGGKVTVQCKNGQASQFTIRSKTGSKTIILVVPKRVAENANKVVIKNREYIIFTDGLILPQQNSFSLLSTGANKIDLKIYPKITAAPSVVTGSLVSNGENKLFTDYSVVVPEIKLTPQTIKTGLRKLGVRLPDNLPAGLNDVFLKVDYWGDTGMAFQNNKLVADDFYRGVAWEIGLKRFIGQADKSLNFYFRPFSKNSPFIIDLPKEVANAALNNKEVLKINSVDLIPEYKTTIKF